MFASSVPILEGRTDVQEVAGLCNYREQADSGPQKVVLQHLRYTYAGRFFVFCLCIVRCFLLNHTLINLNAHGGVYECTVYVAGYLHAVCVASHICIFVCQW